MSKGSEKHKQRNDAISYFGKDLVRRSGSHCELCNAHGTKLIIHEVPPVPREPDFDHCIFICETCSGQIDKPKTVNPDHWRCLNTSAWSQVPAVQVMSVIMLDRLASEDWAVELKDQLYLSPEIQNWLEDIH
ncbi:phnA protein [Litoribacillus peritrichatus]|uniref:PhnA protein N-terminal proteobacterial domain-containing protein n=1 Tax=Litoribacillus peritrichatus TaxID=718191 RepID=A0ABP7MDX5_9GAMM